jgi:hypothetical protein
MMAACLCAEPRGIARGLIRREAERAIGDSGVQGGAGAAYDESGVYLVARISDGTVEPRNRRPQFMGWFTAVSCLVCAVVAAFFATYLNQMEESRDGRFWLMITVLMLFLGVNKQLDLQSLFAEVGRQISLAQGWYPNRRIVQFSFITVFTTALIGVFLWFTKRHRDLFSRYRFASFGLAFLIGFIVIRASAFHHVDEVIQYDLHGIKMNWVLALTGILLILAEGLKAWWSLLIRRI